LLLVPLQLMVPNPCQLFQIVSIFLKTTSQPTHPTLTPSRQFPSPLFLGMTVQYNSHGNPPIHLSQVPS
jgi:hypothetical protein